jgi:hypothetical protein
MERSKMTRHLPLLLSLGVLAAACGSTDGAVYDDFADDTLNTEQWEIVSYTDTGMVEETGGVLFVHDLSGDWDGAGVRFLQLVDLTAGALRIEFRARSGNSEVLCSLAHRATRGDPYYERPMSEWYIKDGWWRFNSPEDGHEATPKFDIQTDQLRFHTYSIQLTPTDNDLVWDYRTMVDDGVLGDVRGKWSPGGGDPTNVHIYFHVCQETGGAVNEGSFIDDIVIEHDSIIGQAGGCQVGL